LQRKMHEISARLVTKLAEALAAEARSTPGDPLIATIAWSLMGAQRALYRSLRERAAGDATSAAISRAHRRDVNRVFDRLRDGLASYPG
jgi:hypothetical protein